MTDKDYDAAQKFLEGVRLLYRKMLEQSEDPDATRLYAQDNLSLFSPWMNS